MPGCKCLKLICLVVAILASTAVREASAQRIGAYHMSPKAMLAQVFVQGARLSLVNRSTPRPDQIARGEILLDLALELVPDDPELWRLRLELASEHGDLEGQTRALRKYCALVPEDDAAQLQLVMSTLSRAQTLQDRMAQVRRILDNPGSASFSGALRSRLASFLAQAATEVGDVDTFRRYLRQAIDLDPVNKQASVMAYQFVRDRGGASPVTVGSALMQVVYASPMDGAARIDLARLLMREGLYESAAEQFAVGNSLRNHFRDDTAVFDWALCLLAMSDFDAAVTMLATAQMSRPGILIDSEGGEMVEPETDDSEGGVPQQPPNVKPADLPLDLEILRLVALIRAGYDARADGSFTTIALELERRAAGNPKALVDLVWLSVLFDRHQARHTEILRQLVRTDSIDEGSLARIRAWMALNEDDRDEAARILEKLGDDRFALYGRALALGDGDEDREAAIGAFQGLLDASYGDMVSLMASIEMNRREGKAAPSDHGRSLDRLYRQWPPTVRRPQHDVAPLIQFEVDLNGTRFSYLEPIIATVTLRNTSEVPLSVGTEATVPTTAFLVVSMQRGGGVVEQPPIIVDLARRLVLQPGESITVEVPFDSTLIGALLARNVGQSVGMSVSGILDPRLDPGKRIGFGRLGSIDAERFVERKSFPPGEKELSQWLYFLGGSDPVERLRAIAQICQSVPRLKDSEARDTQRVRLANGLNDRFERMPAYEQAFACFFLTQDQLARESFDKTHQIAQRSEVPMVRVVYLATLITDSESPVLDASLRHENPIIARFAEANKTGIIKTREQLLKARRRELERRRRMRR
ncbi:MAG: hypothetical protein CMJ18_15825 [Phycisphaeraceae bacterium]|nr:hypothetical protein [Phycisphaeraceae bacterium]